MAQSASEDRGPLITRVTVVVYAVAILFVTLRFFTRGWLVKKFGLDDLFIGIALLLGAGETATLVLQVKHGRGRHSDELEVYQLNRMLMVELLACIPVASIWDVEKLSKKCIAWVPFYISQATINVAIDSVLVLFPLPLLGILKIDRKQRYALVLIFSIGLVPLVATVIRLCYITMAVETKDTSRPYGDTSWRWSWIPVWSQIEVDVGIVAASLPSLSPLLKQVWSGFVPSRTGSPSQIPTLVRSGFKSRRGEVQLQQLPSTSTLPTKSISSVGEADNAKRLTFFDDSRNSEDDEVDCEAFPDPYGSTQIGVAQTVNTRLSRATFVDMPSSPRRDGFAPPSQTDAGV
ncbi:hypothetical protein N0V90_007742 [Kalmusia sp. IMI 367209]|nr:hypothetical protein N0V90_007742 [Kalmusia sp. IMI 367209]